MVKAKIIAWSYVVLNIEEIFKTNYIINRGR